jgi:hypothetical protein
MVSGMPLWDRVPCPVLDADPCVVSDALEADFDFGRLIWCEVGMAPAENQALAGLPYRDPPEFEGFLRYRNE